MLLEIRRFLDDRGFLEECKTPILQPIYGGAAAYPFSTHHRALDMKLFAKNFSGTLLEAFDRRWLRKRFTTSARISAMKALIVRAIRNSRCSSITRPTPIAGNPDEAVRRTGLSCREDRQGLSCKITYQGKDLDFTPPWRQLKHLRRHS